VIINCIGRPDFGGWNDRRGGPDFLSRPERLGFTPTMGSGRGSHEGAGVEMKQIAAAVLAFLATTPAIAGEMASRTLEVQDFSAIEISGAYELEVRVGGDYRVVLSGHEDELNRAEVNVRDGALQLGSKKRVHRDKDRHDHDGLRAVVSMPALDKLSVSGVVDATVEGVDAGLFNVNLSGVGEVDISGRCKRIDARVSGVGQLDAKSLECSEAEVALAGMGEASVFARDWAKAEVSGMGEINVYGSPKKIEKRGGFFSEINVH